MEAAAANMPAKKTSKQIPNPVNNDTRPVLNRINLAKWFLLIFFLLIVG